MPALAERAVKPRRSFKRPKTPLKIEKSAPAKLANATTRATVITASTAAAAAAAAAVDAVVQEHNCSTTPSPSVPSAPTAKSKEKGIEHAIVVEESSSAKAALSSPLSPAAPQRNEHLQPRQQQATAEPDEQDQQRRLHEEQHTQKLEYQEEELLQSQTHEEKSDRSAANDPQIVAEAAETRHLLLPENADNTSDYDLDVTSTSSVSNDANDLQDSTNADGSVRRAAELVSSLAGKRHTRVVMNPPSNNHSNGGPTAFSGFANLVGSAGGLNSRASGIGGRRGMVTAGFTGSSAVTIGGNGSGPGGQRHSHNDSTLRYRTDLDKQVIHFMFERYHQEQICSTASCLSTAAGAGDTAEGNELAEDLTADANGTQNSSSKNVGASSPQSPQQPPAAPHLSRGRCISVEEIYVPANGEGDDKNIGLGDWHFFWMHVGRVRHTIRSSDFRWQDQQIINHFPDHIELTRKDLMYKNIKRYLRENQANNYARLTLYTATDWVSAAANAAAAGSAAGASEDGNATAPPASPSGSPLGMSQRSGYTHGLTTKTFCFADSVPITYNIPNDMGIFKEECQKQRGTQWIVKPTSRSQGKGIFIVDDVRVLQRWVKEKKDTENMASFLATVPANRASWVAPSVLQQQRAAQQGALDAVTEKNSNQNNDNTTGSPTSPTGGVIGTSNLVTTPTTAAAAAGGGAAGNITGGSGCLGAYIVSKYISNPLLIGGKKFDLRLYVLVTSYKPLVAYLHEDGFARFCATRYKGSSVAQEHLGSHLTNVALQKGDAHYNTSHGGKWSLQNLFLYVQGRYGPYAAEGMMRNIQFLIYHSLKAVEPVIFNDKHSFELYGYDILIDDQINPHLIEVNASPSMSTTTVSDRLLKEQVLTDTMKIIFPPGFPTNSRAMPYWEYRQRTDLTTQQQTGFKLLQF